MSHPLIHEVAKLTQGYIRRGGKRNRRQQQHRMLTFADFASVNGARTLAEVGGRQVIQYWKAHEHLTEKTLYNHWRALCVLWELSDKPGKPPRPTKWANGPEAEGSSGI